MRDPAPAQGAFEPFSLRPSPHEWQEAWIARGELRDRRFELPAGVSSVFFERARLANVGFSGIRFAEFRVYDSVFDRCDFTGTAFDRLAMGDMCGEGPRDRAGWPRSVFRDCVFRRTRFPPFTFFGNVRFDRCVFDRSRLRGQTATLEAEFVDCVFLGRVRDINFWGRPAQRDEAALGRDRNEFTGNDFTGAELQGVAFRHIDLHAQRFPGLPGYALLDRIGERARAVLPVVERWPDPRHREEARFSLEFLAGMALKDNDDHALVSPRDMGRRLPPALREELFEAFRRTSSDTSPGRAVRPRGPDPAAP
ncbi:pentapeptide repeat-containing protein [Thermoactinospora rubra]|uniref:pentapeptide repeat-containing protein n=1 Tax=Thermoactinospora rubra TaxID=1088767 RepID=UPI000A111F73|nr:pentapeptide repeat-containing protein [Thermoactinospora rubra]